MKLFRNTFFFFLLLMCALLSCKKKENKILGSWNYVYGINSNIAQIWTFKDDNSVIRSIQDTIKDTATWSINTKLLESSNLKLSNFELFSGTYEILTLNKKYLIL
jgi:hypothetical protein